MSSSPLVLPRFSGSTLEPTSEPIVIYPEHIHQKSPIVTMEPVEPTRRTPSLQRRGKPTFIHIPTVCKAFVQKEPEDDDYSPWSYDEEGDSGLYWDDASQTIYSSASKPSLSYSPPYSVTSNESSHWPPFPTVAERSAPVICIFVFVHSYLFFFRMV